MGKYFECEIVIKDSSTEEVTFSSCLFCLNEFQKDQIKSFFESLLDKEKEES